jgi:hypothetical protein
VFRSRRLSLVGVSVLGRERLRHLQPICLLIMQPLERRPSYQPPDVAEVISETETTFGHLCEQARVKPKQGAAVRQIPRIPFRTGSFPRVTGWGCRTPSAHDLSTDGGTSRARGARQRMIDHVLFHNMSQSFGIDLRCPLRHPPCPALIESNTRQ